MLNNRNKIRWGEDPDSWGPRDHFRNSLIIREVLRNKKKGDVLDFGCGSGHLALRLIDKGFHVQGIDASTLVVGHLKEKGKIKVQFGTEDALFKLSKRFDIVTSGEVLEHLKNDFRGVRGFYKILKKGGICIVTVPAHNYLWDINDEYSSHYRRYEKKDLTGLFKKAGFKIKEVYYFGFPLTYLWHKYVFIHYIEERIKHKSSKNFRRRIQINSQLKNILSLPFWIDQIFNFTEKGGGLLLVAQK